MKEEPPNCPIREFTADGVPVGRCWFWLENGHTCPPHGNASTAVKHYHETGKLTNDPREMKRRAEK